MKMQKLFLTLLISGICLTTFAQKSGTGQNEVEQRGRRNLGGPSHSNLRIPKTNDNVNLTDIEIQIDPATDGGIMVKAKGSDIKIEKAISITSGGGGVSIRPNEEKADSITPGGGVPIRPNTINGRIIITGNSGNNLEYATETPASVMTNKAANRKVVFKSSTGQEYSVVTGSDGKFSLSTVPAGTYSIWVGGKEVILDYILTSTVVKANTKSSN